MRQQSQRDPHTTSGRSVAHRLKEPMMMRMFLVVSLNGLARRLNIWGSGTDNNPGSHLLVQDDANVVIYRPDGTPTWATNTVQPIA